MARPQALFGLARTRTGVLGLSTVGNLATRTVSSIILTRLLRPDDFGIVGIIGSVFYVVALVTDLGFNAFLIRHERTADAHFRNVIWTIHAKRGLALFAGVALASPLIGWSFGKPIVSWPLAVASVTFAINGVASLSLITALRNDKAREISLLDLGLQFFQTMACIALALWWRNAWAMIGAMVLQSAMKTLLSYKLFGDSSQRLAQDRTIRREFLSFSKMVFLSSVLTLLLGQTDKVILGRLFTLREFGLYALALSITSAPTSFAAAYVTRIVFPVYAQAWRERPDTLPAVYYKVRRTASGLYALGCGGLIGAAPLVVAVLYDPRYASASTFISLLMISIALQLPNLTAMELLTAAGEMKALVHVNVVRLVWLALGIPIGFALVGPMGVVAAMGLIEVPATFYFWILLRRARVLDLRQELWFVALIAVGALLGFAISSEALYLFPRI